MRRRHVAIFLISAGLGVAAVVLASERGTDTPPEPLETSEARVPLAAEPAALDAPVTRVGVELADPLEIVERAHTAVVATQGADRLVGADVALELGAPLVVVPRAAEPTDNAATGNAATEEATAATATAGATLRRLGVDRAVVIGDEEAARAARTAAVPEIVWLEPTGQPGRTAQDVIARAAGEGDAAASSEIAVEPSALRELAATKLPAPPQSAVAVLTRPRGGVALQLAVAARAVGHTVIATTARDLRAAPQVIERLASVRRGDDPPQVIVGGTALAALPRDEIAAQVAVAATGVQLPGGGQLVVDPRRPHARRHVALYGAPGNAALGAFGEQSLAETSARARRLARDYRRATPDDVTVIGSFEIIATIASATAGRDRNYARELSVAKLEPAVRAARRTGLYVLLDIQPGRSDFLSLAKRYRPLLRHPHVGLALDPEWRLKKDQRHLEQIGSVGIDEVNEVAKWLARLTRRDRLPQKMFLIHQFRLSMVTDRHRLDTSHDELAYVIQMDGQGPQGTKLETWRTITAEPPDGVHFGWKNFYDEDTPTRSPAATMALEPPPVFVSYQ